MEPHILTGTCVANHTKPKFDCTTYGFVQSVCVVDLCACAVSSAVIGSFSFTDVSF